MRACALVLAVALGACGAPGTTGPSQTPAPNNLAEAQLKYRLVDSFGRLLFCDPDYYPLARADEQVLAHDRLPAIQADAATFGAIIDHLRIAPAGSYTKEQELAIYRDWKMLNALRFEPVSAGFHFAAIFSGTASASPGPATQGSRIDGTIDQRGAVTIATRSASGMPPCPICLARGTRIATPAGEVAVEALRVGDIVWTLDPSGRQVAAPLVAVGSTPVPPTHEVVRLELSDGRSVDVSPGHPTADGRSVGSLGVRADYDGATVVAARHMRYADGFTFDVLPAGGTGLYWANGVLLGSTLRHRDARPAGAPS
jgi:hypothetical protein